jgi:hypothetical protein
VRTRFETLFCHFAALSTLFFCVSCVATRAAAAQHAHLRQLGAGQCNSLPA